MKSDVEYMKHVPRGGVHMLAAIIALIYVFNTIQYIHIWPECANKHTFQLLHLADFSHFSDLLPSFRHSTSLSSHQTMLHPGSSPAAVPTIPPGLDVLRGVPSGGISNAAATVAALGLSPFYPGMLSPYADLPLPQGMPSLCMWNMVILE